MKSANPREAFRELVRRRAEGAPVAYLVGRKEFYSLTFAVSPAVLIPRPESEFVVTEYLEQTRHLQSPRASTWGPARAAWRSRRRIISPPAHFVAIDICEERTGGRQAKRRPTGRRRPDRFPTGRQARASRWRRTLRRDHLQSPIHRHRTIDQLEPGVRDYEPRLALDGGPGGLEMVARLIEESVGLLRPGGHLILEIGTDQVNRSVP